MKKIFTKAVRATRLMTTMIALVASTGAAFAGGDGYFSYFADLIAYPTGAGTVYADASSSTVPEFDGVEFKDFTVPSEQVEVKYVAEGSITGYNATAIPAKGWIFAGFSGAKKDAEGNPVFSDSIYTKYNPGYLNVTATMKSDDEASALANFPLVSDTTHYALFTHIAVSVAEGQEDFGTAKISKVCNEIGDKVTLTATPSEKDATAKFEYWLNATTGEKTTQNPLELTVADTARYQAFFTSDNGIRINFPEEGGKIAFHADCGYSMPYSMQALKFENRSDHEEWGSVVAGDSLEYDATSGKCYQEPDTIRYTLYQGETYILYGKGIKTLTKYEDATLEQSYNQLAWSGEEGKKVSELAVTSHYYSVDIDKNEFNLLAADATIAPNTAYLALTNASYEKYGLKEAPGTIYWINPQTSTGIDEITVNGGVSKKGIYTIDGKKLDRITKTGLYIVDGEKRFYMKK